MNSRPAILAPNRVAECNKKRNVSQTKLRETKIIRVAIGAQHNNVTGNHTSLDAARI
jgi:hypothetical protein